MASILVTLGAVAVCGNLVSVYYFLVVTKKEKSVVKPLYINLAIMDAMYGVLTVALGITISFGRFQLYCMQGMKGGWSMEWTQFSGMLFDNVPRVLLNIFSVISVLRLVAVMLPFRYRYIKKRIVYVTLGVCYFIPLMYGLTPFYYWTKVMDDGSLVRYGVSPLYGYAYLDTRKIASTHTGAILQQIFVKFLPLFLPAITISICSVWLFTVVVNQRKKAISNISFKYSPIITMLVMGLFFMVSKTPYFIMHAYDILQEIGAIPSIGKDGKAPISIADWYIIVPTCWIIDSISSAVNPFIYHLRAKKLFAEEKSKPSMRTANSVQTTCFEE